MLKLTMVYAGAPSSQASSDLPGLRFLSHAGTLNGSFEELRDVIAEGLRKFALPSRAFFCDVSGGRTQAGIGSEGAPAEEIIEPLEVMRLTVACYVCDDVRLEQHEPVRVPVAKRYVTCPESALADPDGYAASFAMPSDEEVNRARNEYVAFQEQRLRALTRWVTKVKQQHQKQQGAATPACTDE
jgi:hypothetical protein